MARGSRKDAQGYPTVQRADLDKVVNNIAASKQEYRAAEPGRSARRADECFVLAASLLRHDGDMGEFTIARQWQDRAARIVSGGARD